MSQFTVDFTTMLIKKQEALRESTKVRKPVKESAQPLKEEEDLELDAPGTEETIDDTVIPEGEDFEESLSDNVFFCDTCKKHFIATADTPQEDIVCPVCNEADMVIAMGSAEDALSNEENQDVAVEMEDEESEEEGTEELPPAPAEEDELKFDESDLEEGFRHLATKHINEKAMLRIREGSISKTGTLTLEGRILPTKKTFDVVFEGFKQNSDKKQFILEGTTSLFNKGNKLRALFIREGNTFKVKKVGYGFIKESAQGKQKVKGILG